jgi:hypothetical protein
LSAQATTAVEEYALAPPKLPVDKSRSVGLREGAAQEKVNRINIAGYIKIKYEIRYPKI